MEERSRLEARLCATSRLSHRSEVTHRGKVAHRGKALRNESHDVTRLVRDANCHTQVRQHIEVR